MRRVELIVCNTNFNNWFGKLDFNGMFDLLILAPSDEGGIYNCNAVPKLRITHSELRIELPDKL